MIEPILPDTATPSVVETDRARAIRDVAQKLEASFVAEMLRHTGLTDVRDTLGGGAGEAAFAGFLADAYADGLVQRGGIGLSEHLVRAIARYDGADP